jgi:hypothetical protein
MLITNIFDRISLHSKSGESNVTTLLSLEAHLKMIMNLNMTVNLNHKRIVRREVFQLLTRQFPLLK